MDNVMTLEWWHWEIAGLALVLLELAVPAFFVIWFGFGAMLVGLALLVAPGLALRTCSQSFEQQRQKCQVDELQAGVDPALAVLP